MGWRVVLSSNPADAASLCKVGNFVYPTLPVSFGGDTKSRRSLLSGVYVNLRTKLHLLMLTFLSIKFIKSIIGL